MKSWSSRLLLAAAGVAGALVIAAGTSAGTLAMWHSQAEVPGATITTGNAGISIEFPTGLDTTQLYPGQTVSAPFTVHNLGTVPLALRVDTLTWPTAHTSPAQQDFADAVAVHIWADTGTGCETPVPEIAWHSTAPTSSGDLGVSIGPATTEPMCLAATLATTAPSSAQGAATDLQVTLEGVQQR